jgi:hypothetical protein
MTAATETPPRQMTRNRIPALIQIAVGDDVIRMNDRRRVTVSGGVLLDDAMYDRVFHLFSSLTSLSSLTSRSPPLEEHRWLQEQMDGHSSP